MGSNVGSTCRANVCHYQQRSTTTLVPIPPFGSSDGAHATLLCLRLLFLLRHCEPIFDRLCYVTLCLFVGSFVWSCSWVTGSCRSLVRHLVGGLVPPPPRPISPYHCKLTFFRCLGSIAPSSPASSLTLAITSATSWSVGASPSFRSVSSALTEARERERGGSSSNVRSLVGGAHAAVSSRTVPAYVP